MTGLEALFTFYMFVNLMNLDTITDEQNARIAALEAQHTEQTTSK